MVSSLRLLCGFVCISVLVTLMLPILLLLLPWRVARIRVTNAFGTIIGRNMMWWSGSRIVVEGLENVRADRPAIYAGNHTSTLDAFTTVWLTPAGTVGVAKKELLYYPFYGQAWWLAGHLLIDRGRTEQAKAALRRTADFILRKGLHLCILPEGRRSDSGQLLPFKKGIIHIALETRLPIVPMVTIGLANAWKRNTLRLQPTDVKIIFLPPITTTSWTEDQIDAHIDELRASFLSVLPPLSAPRRDRRRRVIAPSARAPNQVRGIAGDGRQRSSATLHYNWKLFRFQVSFAHVFTFRPGRKIALSISR